MKRKYNLPDSNYKLWYTRLKAYLKKNPEKTKEEAEDYMLSKKRSYGDSSMHTWKSKERIKKLRRTKDNFKDLSYEEMKGEYFKKCQRDKMNKYYRSNRMYQRLTTRIHFAKVRGDMDLYIKLKEERNQYKKTRV